MSLLAGTHLLAVDTETTGMSPADGHRLVEVARVAIVDGRVGDTWSSLIRPGRPIPEDASRVHGITDAMVANAPESATIARELRAACADLPLVFHNAPFDLPFLPVETAHRALGDTLTTARLFLVLAERWEREKGVRSVAELAAVSLDVMRATARR